MNLSDRQARYITLDGLRGIAVMGILFLNISAFALPDAAYFNPLAYGSERPIDIAAWGFNLVVFDGKMRNLFSFLFGASLLLVVERAEAAGESPLRVHYSRMVWLLLFGLAHNYLIWAGDILAQYAVIGIIAFAFRHFEMRALIKLGIAVLLIHFLIYASLAAGMFALRHAAALPGADASTIAQWRAMAATIGSDPAAIARELERYRGSYPSLLTYRFGELRYQPLVLLGAAGAETLGMVLLGMAALKNGFVLGTWDRARYVRVALIGYAIGLPAMLGLFALCATTGFDNLVTFSVVMSLSLLARPIVMAAHAALIVLWLTRQPNWLSARVIAAGRMAFTNYILTSIAMTTIFYGYGFGLFGRLARADLYPIVLMWCALIMLWSKPWLDRFQYGPFEWLWRSLARQRLQPMQRQICPNP